MIPFNKPYLTGKEAHYIFQAVQSEFIAGNGDFTQKCHRFFEDRYGFSKCLLTTSGTDALEMAALLCDLREGDEVIMPSYTFVSTANAFVLRGAKIVFVDSRKDHPGINEDDIEALITEKTKVIVVVHYGGVASDMDKIVAIADAYGLLIVEDAAHAIDSFYIGKSGVKKALGSIGHFAAFSFHETKNITCGEGGMLVINDERFQERALIIWEKGTNRSAFFRGEVDKYSWIDIGSSFQPSEINTAYLWAQLENIDWIQDKRIQHWSVYQKGLRKWAKDFGIQLPYIPEYATNNAHMFYLICSSLKHRQQLINCLNKNNVQAVFHYQSLHKSPYYLEKHDGRLLPESDRYSDCLVRLPLYIELEPAKVITEIIEKAFESINSS